MDKKDHTRYLICGGVLILALTTLSIRVINLQWLDRDANGLVAKRKPHMRTDIKPAYRGLIVDANEEPLVVNVPLNNLHVDRYHMDDENLISWGVAYKRLHKQEKWLQASESEQKTQLTDMRYYLLNNSLPVELISEHKSFVVSLLAKPLKMDKAKLSSELNHPKKKAFRLAKDLSETEANYIERLLEENRIFGLHFKKHLTRHYPSPTLASHLIGFTRDYQGMAGLEQEFNEQLSGTDGYHKRRSNPSNLSIYSEDEEIKQPESGLDIVLSIDATLQSIVEEELEAGLAFAKAKKGCAIFIDPSTGDIVAMASRPHYNLNTKEGIAEGSRNYIFKTAIEPGSTIKALTVAAGLNEGLIRTNTYIDCENGYFEEKKVVVKDDHPRGRIPVAEILARSNNIGTYKIGRQVGRDRFFEYLDLFGIGKPTALNWKGEARTKGTVNKNSPQEFASATFGYAISVTPMHMAIAYAVIANDGVMMKPNIVKQISKYDGTIVEDYSPSVHHRVLKTEVAKSLRRALVTVTSESYGTAKQARVPGYKVAGKTGTSLKWDKGYKEGRVICSFGGMMPAEKPRLAAYIVIDEPQTNEVKRYGGTLAAPIFSKIAKRAAIHLNIPTTEPIAVTTE